MESQDTLMQYLNLFEQAKKRVDDPSVAAQLVEQVAKDRRVAVMHGRSWEQSSVGRLENGATIDLATPNQLGLLRHLEVDIPEGLTKQQASSLIDQAKARAAAI